jgi:predicted DNA-binding protein (UPF0278 family)
MTSKKTQTTIVKLEVIVAVTQSICTEVSSEQQGVTSHTLAVFQLMLVTHSQQRHEVSIPQSPSVGYVNTIAKLCGVKRVH